MNDRLDAFIDQLQQQIFDEARETLGEDGFERWRSPKYNGSMEKPDASAQVTGSCGDTMEFFLKFDGQRVAQASYVTDGCGSSSVCGSFAAEMAIGRSPDEIAAIDGHTILSRLGRLPEEDQHCAFLASEALQAALHDHMVKQSNSRRQKDEE
ncbi:MAG: iron-sulfur cluster assembly scaffold protein [Desulfosarcinaceae bacterium]